MYLDPVHIPRGWKSSTCQLAVSLPRELSQCPSLLRTVLGAIRCVETLVAMPLLLFLPTISLLLRNAKAYDSCLDCNVTLEI